VVGNDGTFINQEIMCLERVMPKATNTESCRVYLLSDRPLLILLLTAWLHHHNCFVIVSDAVITSSFPGSVNNATMNVENHNETMGAKQITKMTLAAEYVHLLV
jgi:hypothetical protein